MKKNVLTIILCLSVTFAGMAKEKLRVLYVGGSPNFETTGLVKVDSTEVKQSAKERTADFEKFLKQRFTTVKAIQGDQYTPGMSDNYDVTIFDGRITPISPREYIYDDKGEIVGVNQEVYLPDDFDNAVVCIASASEDYGRSIGTKNDWYCLCLNDYALGWKKDHPVFQGPFKPNIQPSMQPTPEPAKEVAVAMGEVLPEMTEMWLVQTESMKTNPACRVGMVSRPGGYLDSPETEIISGGETSKSIDAVAIGRHANFTHWGFGVAPSKLTSAGQDVFANTIVYASKFNNQHPIARKFKEGIATRDHLPMEVYTTTEDCWNWENNALLTFYNTMDSMYRAVIAKKEAGIELDARDMMYESFGQPKKPEILTYGEYVKKRKPDLYKVFGNDPNEYQRYYDKNRGYFRPGDNGYEFVIDEDVRNIGIANDDIALLDKCINMLVEGNKDSEVARNVLERYTLCRFETPQQWREWFDAYNDKMFFTESGGYLWLINTLDPSVPGNDYSILKKEAEPKAAPATKAGETSPDKPVALKAEAAKTADGANEIVVTYTVHPGYHIYAFVDSAEPFIPTTIEFELPEGLALDGNIQNPAGTASATATTFYTGTGQFRQKLAGNGKGDAKINFRYQCCNDDTCLRPVTETLTVTF